MLRTGEFHRMYIASQEEIEAFIRRVIAGEDPKAEAREAYFRSHLIPPGGCSACENVIRAILGES